MSERYWLVHPNGGRQLIDPRQFDIARLAEQARRVGGRLVVEAEARPPAPDLASAPDGPPRRFEPPYGRDVEVRSVGTIDGAIRQPRQRRIERAVGSHTPGWQHGAA